MLVPADKYSLHLANKQEQTELVIPNSTHLDPIVHISTILLSRQYRFPAVEQSQTVARPRSGNRIWNGTLPAGCVILIITKFLKLNHHHCHHHQQTSHTTAIKITPIIVIIIQPHHHQL